MRARLQGSPYGLRGAGRRWAAPAAAGLIRQHQIWYDEILKYLRAVALRFQDCNPLDDEVSGFSGSIIDCGPETPDTIPYNASSCICKKGYRMVTFVGISECSCEKIPYHCQPDIVRENDNVMKCLNATKQNSSSPDNSFYCSVVKSAFSRLSSACENDSLAYSLKDTEEFFENLVINNSNWNTEAKEEVVSAVVLVMEGLGSNAFNYMAKNQEEST
ncbi:UNVERIFIED_CONTAM: hypothetical protein K2H54_057268 [Gekko kuhli]